MALLDDSTVRTTYNLAQAQLAAARTSRKETEVLLVEARADLQRSESLVEQKLASQAELDRSQAAAAALSARLERAAADVVVAQRQLDIYQQQLDDTVIRAPFVGVVVAKNAQPGEMISPVSAGGGFTRTGIGTLVDMSSLEIEIDVNEAYINRVIPDQQVVAVLDAYPDWNIPAHVIAIIPTADRQRATVEVRVGFDSHDPRILPDMGVKVAFQDVEQVAPAGLQVLVPAGAVREEDGRAVVWLVNGEFAERRAVSTGGERDNEMLVTAGLAGGETLILNRPEGLAEGVRVRSGP
jgi:RND family efflux transporter MFP subunit